MDAPADSASLRWIRNARVRRQQQQALAVAQTKRPSGGGGGGGVPPAGRGTRQPALSAQYRRQFQFMKQRQQEHAAFSTTAAVAGGGGGVPPPTGIIPRAKRKASAGSPIVWRPRVRQPPPIPTTAATSRASAAQQQQVVGGGGGGGGGNSRGGGGSSSSSGVRRERSDATVSSALLATVSSALRRGGRGAPSERYALHTHNVKFSADALVVNPESFPDLELHDHVEVYHPDHDIHHNRLLLEVTSLETVKGGRMHISVLKSVADAFKLHAWHDVVVQRVNIEDVAVDYVELVFKDQFISRAEMWLFKQAIFGRIMHIDKNVNQRGSRARVLELSRQGRPVASGVLTSNTKFIYRSLASRLFYLVQMSTEMWEYAPDGQLHFEKLISFLKRLFKQWKDLEATHSLSIVFFSRTYFDRGSSTSRASSSANHHFRGGRFERAGDIVLPVDADGRPYEDFYKMVVANSKTSATDWETVCLKLKREFIAYPHNMNWVLPSNYAQVRARMASQLDRTKAAAVAAGSNNNGAPSTAAPPGPLFSSSMTGVGQILKNGIPSTATQGNFLEALNVCLNVLEKHYMDRDLVRTGNSIATFSAGNGVFEVDPLMAETTKQRMMDNGIGMDMISLTVPPLHSVPLFIYKGKRYRAAAGDGGPHPAPLSRNAFRIPHWMHLCFVDQVKGCGGGDDGNVTPMSICRCQERDVVLHKLAESGSVAVTSTAKARASGNNAPPPSSSASTSATNGAQQDGESREDFHLIPVSALLQWPQSSNGTGYAPAAWSSSCHALQSGENRDGRFPSPLRSVLSQTLPWQALWTTKKFRGHSDSVTGLRVRGWVLYTVSSDGTARSWDTTSCNELNVVRAHSLGVNCLWDTWQEDGNADDTTLHQVGLMHSGSEDSTARTWWAETGDVMSVYEGHSLGIRCVQAVGSCGAGGGGLLFTGSLDGTVKRWDIETGIERQTYQCPSRKGVECLTVVLAAGPVEVGNSKQPSRRQQRRNSIIMHLFMGGEDCLIHQWDASSGTLLRTFEGHEGAVKCLQVCGHEGLLYSGADDCCVRQWELGSGNLVHKFEGHTREVWCLQVLYDQLMYTGSLDHTIREWDVHSGESLHVYQCHTSGITCLQICENTCTLFSGSADGVVCATPLLRNLMRQATTRTTERGDDDDDDDGVRSAVQGMWQALPERSRGLAIASLVEEAAGDSCTWRVEEDATAFCALPDDALCDNADDRDQRLEALQLLRLGLETLRGINPSLRFRQNMQQQSHRAFLAEVLHGCCEVPREPELPIADIPGEPSSSPSARSLGASTSSLSSSRERGRVADASDKGRYSDDECDGDESDDEEYYSDEDEDYDDGIFSDEDVDPYSVAEASSRELILFVEFEEWSLLPTTTPQAFLRGIESFGPGDLRLLHYLICAHCECQLRRWPEELAFLESYLRAGVEAVIFELKLRVGEDMATDDDRPSVLGSFLTHSSVVQSGNRPKSLLESAQAVARFTPKLPPPALTRPPPPPKQRPVDMTTSTSASRSRRDNSQREKKDEEPDDDSGGVSSNDHPRGGGGASASGSGSGSGGSGVIIASRSMNGGRGVHSDAADANGGGFDMNAVRNKAMDSVTAPRGQMEASFKAYDAALFQVAGDEQRHSRQRGASDAVGLSRIGPNARLSSALGTSPTTGAARQRKLSGASSNSGSGSYTSSHDHSLAAGGSSAGGSSGGGFGGFGSTGTISGRVNIPCSVSSNEDHHKGSHSYDNFHSPVSSRSPNSPRHSPGSARSQSPLQGIVAVSVSPNNHVGISRRRSKTSRRDHHGGGGGEGTASGGSGGADGGGLSTSPGSHHSLQHHPLLRAGGAESIGRRSNQNLAALEQRAYHDRIRHAAASSKMQREVSGGSRGINPFNRKDEENMLREHTHNRRRWSHVFPQGEQEFKAIPGPNWKSLCMPATLPLTTDYLPAPVVLRDGYTVSLYTMTLPESVTAATSISSVAYGSKASESAHGPAEAGDVEIATNGAQYTSHTELMEEMVCQRLSQDFQIVNCDNVERLGRRYAQLMPASVLGSKLCHILTMGHRVHFIHYEENPPTVNVTRFLSRAGSNDNPITYRYSLWVQQLSSYQRCVGQTFYKYPNPEYNWNFVDQLVCGYETALPEDTKYRRILFCVIPSYNEIDEATTSDDAYALNERNIERCPEDLAREMEETFVKKFMRFVEYINGRAETDRMEVTVQSTGGGACADGDMQATQSQPRHSPEPQSTTEPQSALESGGGRVRFAATGPIGATSRGPSLRRGGVASVQHIRIRLRSASSGRYEWMVLACDKVLDPRRCYHIEAHWLVASGREVEDFIQSIFRRAKTYSLRLAQVPEYSRSKNLNVHPFIAHPFVRVHRNVMQLAEQALTSIFDFVADDERRTDWGELGVDQPSDGVTGGSGGGGGGGDKPVVGALTSSLRGRPQEPAFRRRKRNWRSDRQYFHRTGACFVRVANQGFAWVNNGLSASHNMAPAQQRIHISQALLTKFTQYCETAQLCFELVCELAWQLPIDESPVQPQPQLQPADEEAAAVRQALPAAETTEAMAEEETGNGEQPPPAAAVEADDEAEEETGVLAV